METSGREAGVGWGSHGALIVMCWLSNWVSGVMGFILLIYLVTPDMEPLAYCYVIKLESCSMANASFYRSGGGDGAVHKSEVELSAGCL